MRSCCRSTSASRASTSAWADCKAAGRTWWAPRCCAKRGIATDSPLAHAFTHLDFETASRRYGKVGGFAHLATLVKRLKASRPGALLLDGGDTWQGSATALWTQGQDMVDAQPAARRRRDDRPLGVHLRHGAREAGRRRRFQGPVRKAVPRIASFVAQNVKTTDFGDPVFEPYVLREINGVPVAIVGQAFPYTPIANPRYFVADWSFGIQDEQMQKTVDDARAKGAQVVVLLSHNGMDVDLKLAIARARHRRHPRRPHARRRAGRACVSATPRGTTLVTNAGSNGKFLGVMDLQVKDGKVADFRYRLLPVFANLLPPDAAMAALIGKGARAVRGQAAARSWRSPTACCTGAATSTAPGTSWCAMR